MSNIIATTERLRLREMNADDAPFILQLLNTPAWLQYIGDRNVRTVGDAEAFIEKGPVKAYQTEKFGFYIVELKNTLESTGICGLVRRPELEFVDLGFAFLPEHERLGYGYESSVAVMDLAKKRFNIQELAAIATPDNYRSIRLLEKLGFKSRGITVMKGEELELMHREL